MLRESLAKNSLKYEKQDATSARVLWITSKWLDSRFCTTALDLEMLLNGRRNDDTDSFLTESLYTLLSERLMSTNVEPNQEESLLALIQKFLRNVQSERARVAVMVHLMWHSLEKRTSPVIPQMQSNRLMHVVQHSPSLEFCSKTIAGVRIILEELQPFEKKTVFSTIQLWNKAFKNLPTESLSCTVDLFVHRIFQHILFPSTFPLSNKRSDSAIQVVRCLVRHGSEISNFENESYYYSSTETESAASELYEFNKRIENSHGFFSNKNVSLIITIASIVGVSSILTVAFTKASGRRLNY